MALARDAKRRKLSESQTERMREEEDNSCSNPGMEQNRTDVPNKVDKQILEVEAGFEKLKTLHQKLDEVLEAESKAVEEPNGPTESAFIKQILQDQLVNTLNQTRQAMKTLIDVELLEWKRRQQLACIGSPVDTSLDHLDKCFSTVAKVLLGVYEHLVKLQDQNTKYSSTDAFCLPDLWIRMKKSALSLLAKLNTDSNNRGMEENRTAVSNKVDKLNRQISEVEAGFERLKTLHQKLDEVLETQSEAVEEPNGPTESAFIKLILQLVNTLNQTKQVMKTLTDVELPEWKRRQQLACIGSPVDTSLDHLDKCFSTVAKVLLGVYEHLVKLQDQNTKYSSTDAFCLPDLRMKMKKSALSLLAKLITNALVVEKQPVMQNYLQQPLILKTKVQFSMTVRFLANIPEFKYRLKVQPVFHKDESAKGACLFDFSSDICKVLDEENEQRGLRAEFVNMKLIRISETKGPSKNCLRVTEELHIIKFVMEFQYAGLACNVEASSLPVVVISSTSQVPSAWASIMWWNVLSTREPWNLSLFINPPPLTWEQLSQVLSWQFLTVGQRGLDEDQLSMLRDKIVDKQDGLVHWSYFSKSKEAWIWIARILYLIKKHLVPLWRDGLIMGFVTKERICQLLEEKQAGTFLLHFSESTKIGAITFSWVDDFKDEPRVFLARPYPKTELSVTPLPGVIQNYLLESQHWGWAKYKNPLVRLYPDIPKDIFRRYESPEAPSEDEGLNRAHYSISEDPVAPEEPDLEETVDAAVSLFAPDSSPRV